MMTASSLGKEAFRVRVRSLTDPTSGTIQFSFPANNANPSAWVAGQWFGGVTIGAGNVYHTFAKTPTVGGTGSGVVLAAGNYDVWAKITTATETIIRKIDDLTVT